MTRDALELRGFLAEVLVERRQDPDAVILIVLELKRGWGYVREVRVSKGREEVHEVDRKGSRLTENWRCLVWLRGRGGFCFSRSLAAVV
jgi:hypothetical protein